MLSFQRISSVLSCCLWKKLASPDICKERKCLTQNLRVGKAVCKQEKTSPNLWICTCNGYMYCIQTGCNQAQQLSAQLSGPQTDLKFTCDSNFTIRNASWEMGSDCKCIYCIVVAILVLDLHGSREGYRDVFCENLPQASPVSSRANARWLQDSPAIGQAWAN